MTNDNKLQRFIDAQQSKYADALAEIERGKKTSHWMWYVFPQLRGLGTSETAIFYGLVDAAEAEAFLAHPVLGARLVEISKAMLSLDVDDANHVLGSPDDMKLKSCMTLFSALPGADKVFALVLAKFYKGEKDQRTLALLTE